MATEQVVKEFIEPIDLQLQLLQADRHTKKFICIQGEEKASIEMVHRIVDLVYQMSRKQQLNWSENDKRLNWAPVVIASTMLHAEYPLPYRCFTNFQGPFGTISSDHQVIVVHPHSGLSPDDVRLMLEPTNRKLVIVVHSSPSPQNDEYQQHKEMINYNYCLLLHQSCRTEMTPWGWSLFKNPLNTPRHLPDPVPNLWYAIAPSNVYRIFGRQNQNMAQGPNTENLCFGEGQLIGYVDTSVPRHFTCRELKLKLKPFPADAH